MAFTRDSAKKERDSSPVHKHIRLVPRATPKVILTWSVAGQNLLTTADTMIALITMANMHAPA